MRNMVDHLLLTLREHLGFTSDFWWGLCCSGSLLFCVVVLSFVCLRPESYMPNVGSISGLSIPDCHSVFCYVHAYEMFLDIKE